MSQAVRKNQKLCAELPEIAARQDPLDLPHLFDDDTVLELLVDGCRALWLVRGNGRERRNSPFTNREELVQWVINLARSHHVRLDPVVGAAGGSLGDGEFRWHCLLPPMAVDGPLVSIRRHRFQSLTIEDFSMSPADCTVLKKAVLQSKHVIVSGPTGAGKTSLLAALIKMLPAEERVFVLESVPEIGAILPGLVRLSPRQANLENIGGFSLERLLAESLRLLPDRLVIGEVRAGEASVLIDALRTGHQGVMATIHASSGQEVLARLSAMAGIEKSSWLHSLSSGLLIVSMQRGNPPSVLRLEHLS